MGSAKYIFQSLGEVNRLLPEISESIHFIRQHLLGAKEEWERIIVHITSNGNRPKESNETSEYVLVDREIRKIIDKGAILRDAARGFVDFPYKRKGTLVMLCWQPIDGDSIQYYHFPDEVEEQRRLIDFS